MYCTCNFVANDKLLLLLCKKLFGREREADGQTTVRERETERERYVRARSCLCVQYYTCLRAIARIRVMCVQA